MREARAFPSASGLAACARGRRRVVRSSSRSPSRNRAKVQVSGASGKPGENEGEGIERAGAGAGCDPAHGCQAGFNPCLDVQRSGGEKSRVAIGAPALHEGLTLGAVQDFLPLQPGENVAQFQNAKGLQRQARKWRQKIYCCDGERGVGIRRFERGRDERSIGVIFQSREAKTLIVSEVRLPRISRDRSVKPGRTDFTSFWAVKAAWSAARQRTSGKVLFEREPLCAGRGLGPRSP